MIQPSDASAFDAQDERAGSGVFGAFADGLQQLRIVGGDDHGDDERAKDIEDHETVDEAPRRFGDIPSRRFALPCSDGDEFRSQDEGETRADERCPKREEFPDSAEVGFGITFECAGGLLPVAETEAVVGGPAAEEEHGAEEDEREDGEDLDAGEPEFGFAVEGDGDGVEEEDREEEDGYPDCNGTIENLNEDRELGGQRLVGKGKTNTGLAQYSITTLAADISAATNMAYEYQ